MDATRVRRIKEDMERADARRLQPHFIASFFLEALKLLGAHQSMFAPLVTHARPLAEIGAAFDQLEHYRDGVGKIVIVP